MKAIYQEMQAKGDIGPMMNVNGQLVPRPFAEFPKVIRRLKGEQIIETVAHSKAEELKILAEGPEEQTVRSPIEKERDSLAQSLADQREINGKLEERMNALMAQLESMKLAQAPKGSQGVILSKPTGASIEAKAILGKK